MAAPLSDDIALRIGLAARVLPDIDTRALLGALLDVMGDPITAAKLSRLRLQKLRSAADGLLSEIEPELLQQAVGLLKGHGIEQIEDPLPPVEQVGDADLFQAIYIACTSNTGERIDGHFGSCQRFLIYAVSPERIALTEIRQPEMPPADVDRNVYRAEMIRDCTVLYTLSIGGPAAAKVVRAGLHPIKVGGAANAREVLSQLQQVLRRDNPPPWLEKAMGTLPARRRVAALSEGSGS